MTEILDKAQQIAYREQGFLILPNFIAPGVCDLLMHQAEVLIDNFDIDHKTIFSTKQHGVPVCQRYFLESSDKIHFFFEENAFDTAGRLQKEKKYAINKIGHALHELDPVFHLFSRSSKIARLATDLAIVDPLIVQSMYICKQPYIGGEVSAHQDSSFLYVDGQPITGLWFALQDATIENGCLWAIPGAHQNGLRARMLRNEKDEIRVETYDVAGWPQEKMLPLTVTKGSVIVLHGLLPHMSYENRSAQSRHAYSLHLMSAQDQWSKQNWLQRPTPFLALGNT